MDNFILPRIKITVKSINASSKHDAGRVVAEFDSEEHTGVVTHLINASNRNDTNHGSMLNGETRWLNPAEECEITVIKKLLDTQSPLIRDTVFCFLCKSKLNFESRFHLQRTFYLFFSQKLYEISWNSHAELRQRLRSEQLLWMNFAITFYRRTTVLNISLQKNVKLSNKGDAVLRILLTDWLIEYAELGNSNFLAAKYATVICIYTTNIWTLVGPDGTIAKTNVFAPKMLPVRAQQKTWNLKNKSEQLMRRCEFWTIEDKDPGDPISKHLLVASRAQRGTRAPPTLARKWRHGVRSLHPIKKPPKNQATLYFRTLGNILGNFGRRSDWAPDCNDQRRVPLSENLLMDKKTEKSLNAPSEKLRKGWRKKGTSNPC